MDQIETGDEPTRYVGQDESGLYWLVEDFGDEVRVSTRRDPWETWSHPVVCPKLQMPAEVAS